VNKHLIGIGSVCVAGVLFALFTQHVWDMQPCPWCIIQRMLYMLLAVVTLVCGAFGGKRTRMGRVVSSSPWKVGSWAAAVIALLGVVVATYQATVASSQVSCNLTLAHKFITATGLDELAPEVFKVRASCADAATATLLGVPFEVASGLLFGIILLWALYLVSRLRSD
jgi:protein dithiol:quinone oxidoreductase